MINYASPATIVATEYHAIQQIMCLGAICWSRNRDDSKSEDTMTTNETNSKSVTGLILFTNNLDHDIRNLASLLKISAMQ